MDAILLPFLQSTEESERAQLLSDLIFVCAAPLIRHTLRQRLGFYVNQRGINPQNHDAEDLYQDVIAKLVQLLNDPQLKSGKIEIKNFRQYVTRVTTNACNDYLRAKSPARSRLKNNLRDLLDRHQDFAVWKTENETLCGFAEWRNKTKSSTSQKLLVELIERPGVFQSAKFSREDIRQATLNKIVIEVFKWVNSPIEVDALVNLLTVLLDIKDHPVESLDDETVYLSQRLIDATVHCGSRLELRDILQRLWVEVKLLPPNQRDTFCLSFEDESGDDLFSLLLSTEIVTLQQLAQELDRSLEQLMSLWQQMPMDNASIANELNATRPQVNKWRFRALRQLEKALFLATTRK